TTIFSGATRTTCGPGPLVSRHHHSCPAASDHRCFILVYVRGEPAATARSVLQSVGSHRSRRFGYKTWCTVAVVDRDPIINWAIPRHTLTGAAKHWAVRPMLRIGVVIILAVAAALLPLASCPAEAGSSDRNPALWSPLPALGAPVRENASVVGGAGDQVIVWGGASQGSIYDPEAAVWRAMSAEGAPSTRTGAGSVWTGDRMLVWGGEHLVDRAWASLDDGAAYDL